MRTVFLLAFSIVVNLAYAQPDSLYIKELEPKYQGPQWIQQNRATFDLSEVAFVNWNAGGTNSISGLVGLESKLNYRDK